MRGSVGHPGGENVTGRHVLDFRADALDRYEAAQARAVQARSEWESSGRCLTHRYRNGVEGIDPMLKVLIACETHADRLGSSVAAASRAGRPQGAQSAPDRQPRERSPLRLAQP